MNRTIWIALVAVIALAIGGWLYLNQSSQPEATDTVMREDDVFGLESESASTNIYTNTKFGYSIKYPSSWTLEPEQKIVDRVNKIHSLVMVHDSDRTHVLQILVNENEWMLKHEAPTSTQVSINGSTQTAYIFPRGYECAMGNPDDPDCSFFVVPIYHNGLWYEIHASGDATIVNEMYSDILSSFRFSN